MKNKTTKTIACLLAGLTLSACVGSVNVPSNAEDETKMDEANQPSGRLTLADFPAHPNNQFRQGNTLTTSCGITLGCSGVYPVDIDIVPLSNNEGRATYTGTIRVSLKPTLITRQVNFSAEAEFKVDFNEKNIRYAGIIGGSATSIKATFNPRGQITGSFELGDTQSDLIGLIGQTEMIGVFAGGDSTTLSGGFTALRE